jgi:hypothetical protein
MMKRLSMLCFALALSLGMAMPAVSQANPETYEKFLTQLEGGWQGNGFHDRGSFNMNAFVQRQGEQKAWDFHSERSGSGRGLTQFYIAGNFLTVNNDDIFGGFAFITEATENRLRYTIQTSQGGNLYDYNYEIDVRGDSLTGRLSIQRNVITIYTESYSLLRQ